MFPVHVLPLAAGGGGGPLQTLQAGLRLQRPRHCRHCRGGLGLLETLGQEECTHRHLSGEEVSIIKPLTLYKEALVDILAVLHHQLCSDSSVQSSKFL